MLQFKKLVADHSLQVGHGMAYSNEFFRVEDAECRELEDTFPGVNVMQEFGKMRLWLKAKPGREKKQYRRFYVAWLCRAHNELLQAEVRGTAIALAKDTQRRVDANVGRGPR
jgi:hypothetical protein